MPPTIRDIAREAGVSIATVSKVMNGHDADIATATRERVRAVAASRGYVSNSLARGLRLKKSGLIGFVVADWSLPVFGPMTKAIDANLSERGYVLASMSSHNDLAGEIDAIKRLASLMVDGIIVNRIYQEKAELLQEAAPGQPLVFIDRFNLPIAPGTGQVYTNVPALIVKCVRRLAVAGSRRIALVCNSHGYAGARFDAYRETLAACGLACNDALVCPGDATFSDGRAAISSLIENGVEFDGLLCGNDLVAEGALTVLHEHGLNFPQDVHIVAADVSYMTSGFSRPFTCASLPSAHIGAAASQMLLAAIDHDEPLTSMEVPYSIIEGSRAS